jgi:2-polyprenyl-6-methoxyphenol hydroxylase-like FAD-dependent oxidoreductase
LVFSEEINLHHLKNMMMRNKEIAIIGGGPGGLTLARILQLKGANVKVYERDTHRKVRVQGGALDLHQDSGLAALEKAGLMDAFRTHYRPGADKIRIMDHNAKIFYDQHLEASTLTFDDEHFRPEIDRGPLRDILLDSLQPGTVIWDSEIASLEPVDNRWKVIFKNGETILADIVVGADGAHSKIRSYVTDIKPVWSGITMVEGSLYDTETTAPHFHQLLKEGKIFAFGHDKTLIISSKSDGSFGFYTGCSTDEFWFQDSGINFRDNQQVLAWFKEQFSDWSSAWEELFKSDKTTFIPRPQYCMPLDQFWAAKKNITIIGDAAHWMPPYSGEGVNMAMQDALELSESLYNPAFADVQQAIAHYEKNMCLRFSEVGKTSLLNTKWMHGPDALTNMLAMFS